VRTVLVVLAAAVIGAGGAVGVMLWEPWSGGDDDHAVSQTLQGTVLLKDEFQDRSPNYLALPRAEKHVVTCSGKDGYSDIAAGAQVLVKDGSGDIIASGRLGQGEGALVDPADKDARWSTFVSYYCEFPFVIEDVATVDFYTVEVSHRGGLTNTREELEALGWNISFELGGE